MQNKRSPKIFTKWAAVSAVAGALERKVWLYNAIGTLYPHLYVLLVGEPGVGKTTQTRMIHKMWSELEGQDGNSHKVALTSINHATITDELNEAKRTAGDLSFNALLVVQNELSVFMPVFDPTLQGVLSALYDAETFGQRRRTGAIRFNIPNPQVNLLAATTPSVLSSVFPGASWNQGLPSRFLMCYSNKAVRRPLWLSGGQRNQLDIEYQHLCADLVTIGKLLGEMSFTEGAQRAIDSWEDGGCAPKPTHPQLLDYNARRLAHLLKLSMVLSASRDDSRLVTQLDIEGAMELLFELEATLPILFDVMNLSGDEKLMQELHLAMLRICKKGQAVSEAKVVQYLSKRTPNYNVENVIKLAVMSGLIRRQHLSEGGSVYVPQNIVQ